MDTSPTLTLPAPAVIPIVPTDKWQREYSGFLQLKSSLLGTHAGQYVVVHNGSVVDSGPDEVALALRFFEKYGNVPVHIGLITDAPESAARIPHYKEQKAGA